MLERLTSRELEVLSLMAKGLSNKEIAEKLCLSLTTVRCHCNHIFSKFYLDSENGYTYRIKATLIYLEERREFLQNESRQIDKYLNSFEKIEEICNVNSLTTCWTALNLCKNCNEKRECGLQSPFAKLKAIKKIINELRS